MRTALLPLPILLLMVGMVAGARAADAQSTAPTLAERAIRICTSGDDVPTSDRLAALEHAVALAEAALDADAHDGRAHFALFCALGRRAQLTGAGITAVATLVRLRRAIDRAVELGPTDADALTAKAMFLTRLPRWLGGDVREAEHLARRALAVDPDLPAAHLALAEALVEIDTAAAQREAAWALDAAERSRRADDAVAARLLLQRLANAD